MFQTILIFLRFCQTLELLVTEGCVVEVIVGDVALADVLTTTTGLTIVVVFRYWALTSGTCPTDLRIGVVIIFPVRLDGARMWAVTWLLP